MKELQEKLASVSGSLSEWSVNSFGNVRRELKNLYAELEKLRADPCVLAHRMQKSRYRRG